MVKILNLPEKEIVKLYEEGGRVVEIAKSFKVCNATIYKILKRNGVKIDPWKRLQIVTYDRRYFKIVNNQIKAYFLGFILR